MIAAYEAFNIAEKAEIKMDILLELIRVSSGNSWIVENWDTVRSWKDNYMEGGTLDLIYKDIKLTMAMGESLKVPLHLSALAAQLGRY
jgi:3-hydroxyisobutyrate dehydrogenase-like beta-hydroxyacid dehydrogenase